MKKLKFYLSLLIVFAMFMGCADTSVASSVDATAESSSSSQSEQVQTTTDNKSQVPMDTLMVGVQEMSGDFISGFGNNAYDLSVKTLIAGYMDTHVITEEGEILLNNTVVASVETVTDDAGNKTFTYVLHDDLFWNNGENITAKDYIASAMWYSSPEWAEAGASSAGQDGLVGFTEYNEGTTDVFSGVQLIDELSFSLTVSAENLPYYWENLHATASPIHFDSYLPSCEIVSTEEGTSLVFAEGDLLTNCTRIASTERYAPSVTCGPYSFVSFENQTVTLQRNEYFKGDDEGNVPTLEYVVQTAIPLETAVEWVINGQIDVVEGIVEPEKIEAAKASDAVQLQSFARSGYGYLAMMCDVGPTADVNVRWALASLIDRNAVVDYVLGSYGTTVNSEYGIGQWMYQELGADLQEDLIPISFNINAANTYLDKTEWTFEADGTTAFDASKAMEDGTYLRHNANGEPLVINHLGQSNNVLTDIIEIQYVANAPLAGIDFNLEKSDWNAVLENYYNAYELEGDARIYNTFNLATNFSSVFDRYYTWHSDFLGTSINKPQLSDAELDELIITMRTMEPDNKDGYLQAWYDYQVRWNEILPQIPLYSNEYFDVVHNNVDNFDTTAYAGYESLICKITKTEK